MVTFDALRSVKDQVCRLVHLKSWRIFRHADYSPNRMRSLTKAVLTLERHCWRSSAQLKRASPGRTVRGSPCAVAVQREASHLGLACGVQGVGDSFSDPHRGLDHSLAFVAGVEVGAGADRRVQLREDEGGGFRNDLGRAPLLPEPVDLLAQLVQRELIKPVV
ncbi:hypothetical protein [Streptomyces sp. NBC_01451]|uniref:hypothetical protein n=1 Tax=Streptomyces sp. NBC_01451 TaxID=2903872 RepID=UPI003FCC8CA9